MAKLRVSDDAIDGIVPTGDAPYAIVSDGSHMWGD